ncbi:MAG: hypothetical protein ACOCRO_04780 [Halanaerobiales bacterium]
MNSKLEKRIYSAWAYSDNQNEKAKINREIYEEIKDKAEVELIRNGYGHNEYRVVSNPENLTDKELALIADRGNLCFGFRKGAGTIIIHTD